MSEDVDSAARDAAEQDINRTNELLARLRQVIPGVDFKAIRHSHTRPVFELSLDGAAQLVTRLELIAIEQPGALYGIRPHRDFTPTELEQMKAAAETDPTWRAIARYGAGRATVDDRRTVLRLLAELGINPPVNDSPRTVAEAENV